MILTLISAIALQVTNPHCMRWILFRAWRQLPQITVFGEELAQALEQAERRVSELEARLARYQQQFGDLPDDNS